MTQPSLSLFDEPAVEAIAPIPSAESLSDAELVSLIEKLNASYRAAAPLVSDSRYEKEFLGELRRRMPEHPFLSVPEPAEIVKGTRVKLPAAMLSTEKAYSVKEVQAWCDRVAAAAKQIGVDARTLVVELTPKFDGIAAYDTGDLVCTRGRQGYGTDITRWFDGARSIKAQRGRGAGEIVVSRSYFDRVLATEYGLDHPRNFVSGLVISETMREYHERALDDGEVRLVNYCDAERVTLPLADLVDTWEQHLNALVSGCEYLCDGVVAEICDAGVKAALGSASTHHRWQIALKRNEEFAETTVVATRMTCARTGRITPTLVVEPVTMYGATISHVTAHTARHLLDLKLGAGARVRITRGGGVIPTLVDVLQPAPTLDADLDYCPCCGGETEWEGKYLICPNTSSCGDQSSKALLHFFKTLAVCNGFGPTVTDALTVAGIVGPLEVYALDAEGLTRCGVHAGVARNLRAELDRSLREPIADAVLLGALGIRFLGRGDSRRLLAAYPLESLGEITAEQIGAVEGFGPLTSAPIAASLRAMAPTLAGLLALGFNLERTAPASASAHLPATPISGMTIVFTGTMTGGTRDAMEAEARRLGATVGSAVNKKTSLLVCGANVGAAKSGKAAALNVKVMTEAEYRALIA